MVGLGTRPVLARLTTVQRLQHNGKEILATYSRSVKSVYLLNHEFMLRVMAVNSPLELNW